MSIQTLPLSAELQLSNLDNMAIAGFLSRYRGNTLREYRNDLRVYLGWCLSNSLDMMQAKRPHLELYIRWMEQQNWSQSTVARRFGSVALLYKYATIDELLLKDPAASVSRPKVNRLEQKRSYLTPLEFSRFLDAARAISPTAHLLAGLLGMMGLRIGEAIAIDFEHLAIEGGYDVIKITSKGGNKDVVPVPIPVLRALRDIQVYRSSGPVLYNNRGARMDRASATRLIGRICREGHVSKSITPHSLRRTSCTSGLVSGIPLRDMQIAMRHKSPNTTAIYDMATHNLDRHASHRIASYLGGMTG